MTAKYVDHLPLHRQAQIYTKQRQGVAPDDKSPRGFKSTEFHAILTVE